MKLIAKRLNLIGLLLLVTFGAIAAGLYFDAPAHSQPAKKITTTDGRKYVCPMHPEVVSERPGQCSKCGMALRPAAEAQAPHEGCGMESQGHGCCGEPPAVEITLPPGHPPVPGYKTHSGCATGAVSTATTPTK